MIPFASKGVDFNFKTYVEPPLLPTSKEHCMK